MIFQLCISIHFVSSLVNTVYIDQDDYGIILDAGSSGTKLKIYTWNRYHQTTINELGVSSKYNLQIATNLKFPPGIGTKAESLEDIPTYLTPIIETAKHTIPETKHATTPVYFLATAGKYIPLPFHRNNPTNVFSALDRTEVLNFIKNTIYVFHS